MDENLHRRQSFTPRETVGELDRYIVGQDPAKRAVAIALRNRWRRQRVDPDLRDEIVPKNILMIGPTGVGKTEIARRLAKLIKAPFVKVEASKFTEVGYVGRDVESMVRDLVEVAVNLVREEAQEAVLGRAEQTAEDRLLKLLLPEAPEKTFEGRSSEQEGQRTRETFRRMLREGKLDERMVEVELSAKSPTSFVQNFSAEGVQDMVFQLQDLMGARGGPKKRRKVPVSEAKQILLDEEIDRLIDLDQVHREALEVASQSGIIFIDEIDKVATGAEAGRGGPDVSREGVQRDLLPIVEGSTVTTKYGRVRTDHVLFIAAGAFHTSKVSDLIPELQGRFPIRVELTDLDEADFIRILHEPKNSLIRQYTALLATEGVQLRFTDEAVRRIAAVAAQVNATVENIGARRLHTVLEALLEELSFDAPERGGTEVLVDDAMVDARLSHVVESEDLSRFVL
jgi:ATP-dependent HslUV protease ATP-binding subunit HslU